MRCKSSKQRVSASYNNHGSFLAVVSLFLPAFLFSQAMAVDAPLRGLIKDYCVSCHNPDKKKGKLDLESILEINMGDHFEVWDEVAWMLREREMPPEDKPDEPRPTEAEYDAGADWLDKALENLGTGDHSSPAISSKLAVVDKYCTSCHNAEENKGGMNLDAIGLIMKPHTQKFGKM